MDTEKRCAGLRRHSQETNALVKECLRTAMVSLAMTTDYNKVTVTQLCEKAGVSRMAFYRNYSVTGDVIREIASELNNAVIQLAGSPFRTTTDVHWYIRVFYLIAERKEEMHLMFHKSFQHQWMHIVNELVVHDNRFTPEQQYLRIMWSGGFENAVAYWLNSGMRQSPEEMAEYCMQYLPHLPDPAGAPANREGSDLP